MALRVTTEAEPICGNSTTFCMVFSSSGTFGSLANTSSPAARMVPDFSAATSAGSLRDRKIGIVGMGRIGQAIGRRLEASRVPVSYHSRNPSSAVSYQHYPDLMEMAKAVDTLIVIVPGGASTTKMINADVFKALGPRGVVINVARGSVVDEPALIAALKSGTILAAGLDVFANEPNVPDELRTMQNVVLLPHIGSASVVTRNAMDQLVVDNLKHWFAGKPPLTPVAETPVKGR